MRPPTRARHNLLTVALAKTSPPLCLTPIWTLAAVRLLQRFDFEWTASRISRNSFGPFRSRRFRRCRSSSGADGSRSLSNCVEAKPRAFDLAFWVRDLAGCATASACSRRRRIASGRDNRASWRPIQASKAASWAGCKRTRIGSPLPVAGGPRFLGGVSD